MSVMGYCIRSIGRLDCLDVLLNATCQYFFRSPPRGATHIVGWGIKPTTDKARRLAVVHQLPYVSIEDGFLRSFGLGVKGAPLHSLCVDYTGVYYDASRPSDLEKLIAAAAFSEADLVRAGNCMLLLRQQQLSKFNHAAAVRVTWPDNRPRVLVVDQTYGDASVLYGDADEQSFVAMLDTALAEHPDAEIVVKVHPEVIAGIKQGYLLDAARARRCTIWNEDICPWSMLDAVDEVYVVTSQMGFDALLAGKRVNCFGLPFYAGWGLTRDRQRCERRGVTRTLAQVFAAAYLQYCRYINPYTGQRCELEETIQLISDQKRVRQRLDRLWLAVDFSGWKKKFVPRFLGKPPSLTFISSNADELRAVEAKRDVVAWSSKLSPALVSRCRQLNCNLWRMEDGFVRSVGLGIDLVAPMSLVLDSRGIYYDANGASDLEVLLNRQPFDALLLARARQVRAALVASQLSKYNVGVRESADKLRLPAAKKTILVPGQVETDASIVKGSPQIKTNLALLQQVRLDNPDAFIIYKPHPDVVGGGRVGVLAAGAKNGLYDLEVVNLSILTLLDQVDEVHTMCSLTGFEALLREVKVVTYGLPFYAGWGLTSDRLRCARRQRQLSLDELVAGALILYPLYVDPKTGDQINIETLIQLLTIQRREVRADNWRRKLYRYYRNRFLKC